MAELISLCLIIWLIGKIFPDAGKKTCPYCKMKIPYDAIVCAYCKNKLD